jgi:hypothetical protein
MVIEKIVSQAITIATAVQLAPAPVKATIIVTNLATIGVTIIVEPHVRTGVRNLKERLKKIKVKQSLKNLPGNIKELPGKLSLKNLRSKLSLKNLRSKLSLKNLFKKKVKKVEEDNDLEVKNLEVENLEVENLEVKNLEINKSEEGI